MYDLTRHLRRREIPTRNEPHSACAKENEAVVRHIHEELWDERKLEIADEVIAEEWQIFAISEPGRVR